MYDYLMLLGPTASGKTQLALEVAQEYPIEIVSVDSVSVYKGLDIGSAKPTPDELASVPHHLIDECDLSEIFTVGKFVDKTRILIKDIRSRGNIPLLCGGTMMYGHVLSQNYGELPVVDDVTRHEIDLMKLKKGSDVVYQALLIEDPAAAKLIHPNDIQRAQRALGVKRSHNRSLLEYWGVENNDGLKGLHFLIHIDNRADLRSRIQERTDMILHMGLVEECHKILTLYPDSMNHPALRSIGYRQVLDLLRHEITHKDLGEKISIATAQYAKRQMTWIKRWKYKDTVLFPRNEIKENLCHILSKIS